MIRNNLSIFPMTKKMVYVVATLIIILLLSLFLLLNKNDSSTSEVVSNNKEATSTIEVKPTIIVGEGSLDLLANRGENLECSILYKKDDISGQTLEGTYFTSLKRMRGDFIMPEGGVSSVIVQDGFMYTWSIIEGQKYGMKVNLDELKKAKASTTPDTREAVPLEANVKYDCEPWNNVDGSIFEPPTDIIFTEFSDVMNGGMEYGTIYEDNKVDVKAMMKEMKTQE